MEARVEQVPHRARYLRVLNASARRTHDTQHEWLDRVDEQLGNRRSRRDVNSEPRRRPRSGQR
jgi:hypothetical protein